MNKLLKQLGNDDKSVALVEKILLASLGENRKPKEIAANIVKEIQGYLSPQSIDDMRTITSLQKQLSAYQNVADLSSSTFIDLIVKNIVDSNSAFSASTIYTIDWFAGLNFSIKAKSNIAEALIKSVSLINVSYVQPFWRLIVAGDPDTLNSIAYGVAA